MTFHTPGPVATVRAGLVTNLVVELAAQPVGAALGHQQGPSVLPLPPTGDRDRRPLRCTLLDLFDQPAVPYGSAMSSQRLTTTPDRLRR